MKSLYFEVRKPVIWKYHILGTADQHGMLYHNYGNHGNHDTCGNPCMTLTLNWFQNWSKNWHIQVADQLFALKFPD